MRWRREEREWEAFLREVIWAGATLPPNRPPHVIMSRHVPSSAGPRASSTSVLPYSVPILCKLLDNVGLSSYLSRKLHFSGAEMFIVEGGCGGGAVLEGLWNKSDAPWVCSVRLLRGFHERPLYMKTLVSSSLQCRWLFWPHLRLGGIQPNDKQLAWWLGGRRRSIHFPPSFPMILPWSHTALNRKSITVKVLTIWGRRNIEIHS